MNVDGCHKLFDDVFTVIALGLRDSLVSICSYRFCVVGGLGVPDSFVLLNFYFQCIC